jgi:UDP-glucose 4-epimerase
MFLIAGGAGFLGLTTAEQLAASGQEVVITTHRRNDTMAKALADSSPLITLEFCDLYNTYQVNDLFARYRFETVIHTATAHMFAAARATNFPTYLMLFNTLEASTNTGVRRFILSGSFVVYRGVRGPFREDMPLPSDIVDNPPSPLQFVPHFETTVKRVNELVALDYGLPIKGWDQAPERSGRAGDQLEVVVTRCPIQFGPRYTSMYSSVSNAVHAAVRGHPVPAHRQLSDVIDSVYIKDSASALVALSTAATLPNRIYNVSSNIRFTAPELLAAVVDAVPGADQHLGVSLGEAQPLPDDYLDISRIKSDIGWKPEYTLEAAIADYARWLQSHDF